MRNPRAFFEPLCVGAPRPAPAVSTEPSRMIHFFDPGNERMRAKLPDLARRADVLLGNLEDAVPTDRKNAARAGLVEACRSGALDGARVWCRINALDSPWVLDDVTTLVSEVGAHLEVLMVPKVEGPRDVHFLDRLLAHLEARAGLTHQIGLHAIVETALGVTNLEAIAASSPRMQGMSFGPADLAASRRMRTLRPGGPHPGYRTMDDRTGDADNDDAAGARVSVVQDLWHASIVRMVDACAAFGLLPFYGPFGDISDPEGCEVQFRAAAVLGCVGAWSLHPGQIDIARRVFTPPADEVAAARRVLDALPDGSGVRMIDGRMTDDASWKQCRAMVDFADRAAERDARIAGDPLAGVAT
ncbi:HpcH/HpaI aldolase/citrate lyase family protein [Pseudonocardia sulfidoxydans]|uniref:HpcH/HpaI aldolase/citrate lyase family protein n=1 Tax=Pseudonocardia sulfidoxydans TaxID=54011 RepID=UPI0011BE7B41|nr:CoA ester lyase [Pseudonocardia sulfidoxydans]